MSRVLIVEDEEAIAEIEKDYLEWFLHLLLLIL